MSKEVFLIDTNSLITPHLNFYPFDFAPGFWSQMGLHIENGSILILDMVKAEILQGNDRLKEWMESLNIGMLIDHRTPEILAQYSAVLQSLQNNPVYKNSALAEWSRATVADPWLIAAAVVHQCTIITFETHNGGLNPNTPSKVAKIPDISDAFHVKTQNLYYMMRSLGFKLDSI